ncbi:MAG: 2-C-methyl-D-erythritol 2,4-cyclodiphosphate synthase [Desulfotomaculaceae bacterium]|nr:2-C-methyl-D-erythritol 2,4-cyclodiphosphate synthase [Desulfotomaculaceae bacterium]
MLIGFGFDVHRLAEGRPLVLGGVNIPFDRGLLGHSDADVLVHAVMDSLLGAAGEGDIGRLFPDNDRQYRGISSLSLLMRVREILVRKGLVVGNIDSVIVAQSPKLAPFMDEMKINIAETLHINPAKVNIKATTTEGLGFTGTSEGFAAYAIAMVLPAN